ncbi:MAG TPA: DUF397 domain-containing protein [Acidimicrobiales bacterium]
MSHQLNWRKSTLSGSQGNCVEIATLPDGTVAMRDSKNPDAALLTFGPDEWAAFLEGCKNGEFGPG